VSATTASGNGAVIGSGAQPILRVEGLSIGFGGREVVHGISFEIAAGQTLGLVGESGSGKSATALAAMRLLPAEASVSGRILFTVQRAMQAGAVDLLALPEREMRRRRGSDVAMVFQEPMTALNPVMRVGAQIAEAVRAHQPGLSSKAVDRLVLDAMREVALPEPERRARDYPHQFSGGQRQRILIAMAIVNRPRLLIADEPTTALDVTVQAQILALLKELRRTHGLSMLFISHDLAVVAEACDQPGDRVAVMQHGRIVEQAETRAIYSPTAARVHAAAAGVGADDGDRPHAPAGVAGQGRLRLRCDKLRIRALLHELSLLYACPDSLRHPWKPGGPDRGTGCGGPVGRAVEPGRYGGLRRQSE
jgi:peptide/nickel transport system ATP-binding protein